MPIFIFQMPPLFSIFVVAFHFEFHYCCFDIQVRYDAIIFFDYFLHIISLSSLFATFAFFACLRFSAIAFAISSYAIYRFSIIFAAFGCFDYQTLLHCFHADIAFRLRFRQAIYTPDAFTPLRHGLRFHYCVSFHAMIAVISSRFTPHCHIFAFAITISLLPFIIAY